MSILTRSHGIVDANNICSDKPKMIPMSRKVVDELVVLAALVPLAVADLGAEFHAVLFATDASEVKGAITYTESVLHTSRCLID